MKPRLIRYSLFLLFMIAVSASLTFGQTAASVTWNLIGADSLSPTTTVGDISGQSVEPSDSIAVIDVKPIPNSPISGVTNALRWAPYANGAKVSWGDETGQNNNRWVQFAVAPNSGNAFVTDSISIYLGASGTTNHIRANFYYSTDPAFVTKTLINPSDTGVIPYRDSLQHFGYNANAVVNEGDTLYFRVYPWYDGAASTSKYLFIQYAQIFGNTVPPVVSIDSARKSLNDTVTVMGVTFSPNFQTNNRSYYILDGTDGIVTFKTGLISPALNLGDSVVVTGKIALFNGLLEIQPTSDNGVAVLDSNAALPDSEVITIHEFNTNGEKYESHLIEIKQLSLLSGTWPTSGSKSIYLTDGTDTLNVYLDSDMKLFNSPEPTWPVDMVGVGSQFAASGVGGYQLLPRFISDFIEAPVVPVELTSFSAQVSAGMVILSWKTATETNNAGFEIQRGIDGKNFAKVGFVNGHGTTVNINKYSFSDKVQGGIIYYRLKQIDLNGSYSYSEVVQVAPAIPKLFSLSQNYPNPFNPSTTISYDLPSASKVVLKVYDILGNEVTTLVNQEQSPGSYKIIFNSQTSDHKQLSSGIYFYKLEAGTFSSIRKMLLLK